MRGPGLTYDLTGQRFGKLLVKKHIGALKGQVGRTYWSCICDCGIVCAADSFRMRNGLAKSCGCGASKYSVGDTFGRLTLIALCDSKWRTQCTCGSVAVRCPTYLNEDSMCGACAGKEKLRKKLAGQTFGRLTAIKSIGTDKHRNAIWLLKCECGADVVRRINEIHRRERNKKKTPQSCGKC